MQKEKATIPAWFIWTLAILLSISGGITYRVLASRLKLTTGAPVKLPIPLSDIPLRVGNWTGRDVPIPTNIQRAAKNDDYINRLYVNKLTNEWVNVYVAYTARPRTMSGHRPDICYPAGGWVHDGTTPAEVVSLSGMRTPCLMHRFHWPSEQPEERVVLNFYILNGQLTANEDTFSGIGWRTPNIGGNPARYVAQVQISSVLENSARKATADMSELLLDFLPDPNGRVKAATYRTDPNESAK